MEMLQGKAVTPTKLNLRFILPLALIYLMIYLAADAVAFKLIAIKSFIEPGPPFIFPLSYIVGAIIAEVYGSDISKKIIWFTLICQLLYAFLVSKVISLPPPLDWPGQASYDFVFGDILHFVFSGTIAVLASSFVNVYLIAKMKVLLDGKYYCLRNIISTAAGGFILIAIIVVFVYLPALGVKEAFQMAYDIYALELFYTIIFVFPSWAICGFLKKYEHLDVYDYNIKFNPFKF
ncbi:MAG: VUT family protein [Gammaproteobacteria bacterium]